jgi:hypothetical protein
VPRRRFTAGHLAMSPGPVSCRHVRTGQSAGIFRCSRWRAGVLYGWDSSPTCPAASSVGGAVRCRGVGGQGAGFRGGRGRRGMGVGGGARSAPSGGGGREGVRGNRGTRALGGSRVPLAFAVSWSGRHGAVCAAGAVHFPRSLMRREPSRFSGRQEWGSGGKPGTGPCFFGAGGFRVLPQCVSGLVLPVVCLLVE